MNRNQALAMAAVFVFLTAVAGSARSRDSDPLPPTAVDQPAATVASAISFQGRLVQPATDLPLSGVYDLAFTFWTADAPGGSQIGSEILKVGQGIAKGLYSTQLPADPAVFTGQELWLQIRVRPSGGAWETLAPRVQVLPAAYAMSLRPGARISGEPTAWTDGWVLGVTMEGTYPLANAVRASTATGTALYGASSGGSGIFGYSENGYAIYALDAGSSQARGYAGYFTSTNGIGVYAASSALPHFTNSWAPAVYGVSANGVGVVSSGPLGGVRGMSTDGIGVYGESTSGTGVSGRTRGASDSDYGVYGTGGDGTYAIAGFNSGSSTGLAVYGRKMSGGSGVSGVNEGNGNGMWGSSKSYNGVNGNTQRADNNYGLYTPDNLYSLNIHLLGATMQVAQNAGPGDVERGDVVAIAGMTMASEASGQGVIQVRRAHEANSNAVLGVVASNYPDAWLKASGDSDANGAGNPIGEIPLSAAGPISPGGYMLIVVQGPAEVKLDPASDMIQPGDLVASAKTEGHAARASTVTIGGARMALPGTVLGKALEPAQSGQKLLRVFVTLR